MTLDEKIAKLKELAKKAPTTGWFDGSGPQIDLAAYDAFLRNNALDMIVNLSVQLTVCKRVADHRINELEAENKKLQGKIAEFIDGERCGPND